MIHLDVYLTIVYDLTLLLDLHTPPLQDVEFLGHDLLHDPPEELLVFLECYFVGELVGDLEPAFTVS